MRSFVCTGLPAGALCRARAVGLGLGLGLALGACKPSSQKVKLGPFTADRYEEKDESGARLDCYSLAPDSNKPARLCGEGQPTPGFDGFFLNARTPAAGSKFVSSVGAPVTPGWYVIRPQGSAVDVWALGPLPMHEWLGGGKALLGVETGADHHTHVHVIDPQGRSDRAYDVGQLRADEFLLVREQADKALLLVQKKGGEEVVLVREPLGNPEVAIGDASDDKSPGNRKFHKRGDLARQNGGQWIPTSADLASIGWKDDMPLYDGSPMGPFDPVK